MSGLELAASSALVGGILVLPLAAFQLPDRVPGWEALASLAALTLVNSVGSQLLSFRILRLYGPARSSLSTYTSPPLALLLGAAVLGEPVTGAGVAGMVLILAGVAVGSGTVGRPFRAT
jgi:drug/metabolite transporter (DMT)-like permease